MNVTGKFRAMAMRLIGPLEVTAPRIFILVVLSMVTFWVWWTNQRVSVFHCTDEIVGQGMWCAGVDEYVRLHIAFYLIGLAIMALLFVTSIRLYVLVFVFMAFIASSAIVFELWISAYGSDSILHAQDLWKITIGRGLVANSVGAVGILGNFALLIFFAERSRRKR